MLPSPWRARPRASLAAWVFGLVLLAPVLAPPLAAALAAAASAPTFAAPIALPDSTGFGEPGIAVAPDGTLYVVAPGTAVWRSSDAGASWERVADTLGNSGDSDIAVDLDGLVYGSDLFDAAPVSVSNNRATSFQYVTDTNPGDEGLDREWIAVAGHGDVFATVRDGGSEELSVSHDRGQTFSSPRTVDLDTADRGNILAVSSLDLYIPYTDGTNGDMHLAASHDGGTSWTVHTIGPTSGASCDFPAVARDAAGTLYVVWCEILAIGYPQVSNARIQLAVSKDDGATWTGPLQLSDDANFNAFPWVAAGNAGRVMVAWYEGASPISSIDPLHLRDPNLALLVDWHVTVGWSLDADQASPTWTRTVATGATHSGPICTEGILCPPSTRNLLDFFEVVEMPGGNLAVTFAGGDVLGVPDLSGGGSVGTISQLYAMVQTAGSNLRTG